MNIRQLVGKEQELPEKVTLSSALITLAKSTKRRWEERDKSGGEAHTFGARGVLQARDIKWAKDTGILEDVI